MNRFIVALIFSSQLFASSGDLTLPNLKWFANFTGYICAAFTPVVARPAGHEELNVIFETIKTDSTLDNILLEATFQEEDSICRYTAILLADNDASTSVLVNSSARLVSGTSECLSGKALLDSQFEANDYLYYGHPHNAALMVPSAGAEALCGAGATHIGINFVVKGRL